jgi:hypothetical protein
MFIHRADADPDRSALTLLAFGLIAAPDQARQCQQHRQSTSIRFHKIALKNHCFMGQTALPPLLKGCLIA